MDVDDLILDLPENIASNFVEGAFLQWHDVDKNCILKPARSGSGRKRKNEYVVDANEKIPSNFFNLSKLCCDNTDVVISSPELHYLKDLYSNVFNTIPELDDINCAVNSAGLESMKLKLLCDDEPTAAKRMKVKAIMHFVQETNFISNISTNRAADRKSTQSSQHSFEGEESFVSSSSSSNMLTTNSQIATLTFVTLNSNNSDMHVLCLRALSSSKKKQVVEVVFNQTLQDLHKSMYCVVDQLINESILHNLNTQNTVDTTGESNNLQSLELCNKWSFFVIGGVIYFDSQEGDKDRYLTNIKNNKCVHKWLIPLLMAQQKGQRKESLDINSVINYTRMKFTMEDIILQNTVFIPMNAVTFAQLLMPAFSISSATDSSSADLLTHTAAAAATYENGSGSRGSGRGSGRGMLEQICVYWHHNQCKHSFYFSDFHNFHSSIDLPMASSYPRLLFHTKMNRRVCEGCKIWSARHVVYEDRLASTSPVYLCQHCHYSLHYDKNGRLMYQFIVYPYIHDE